MKKAILALTLLALLGFAQRTDATEVVIYKKDFPECHAPTTTNFTRHPFDRHMLFRGENVQMTERKFWKIANGDLSEYDWQFSKGKAQQLSAYYAGVGNLKKLRHLTPIIERLHSEEMARRILLSNPRTYLSYLGHSGGLAIHQLHLWQATGDTRHLNAALVLARQQIAVWEELPTAPKYREFKEFVLSIVPSPPPPMRKSQKLPDPRVGAGIHSGQPPKLHALDLDAAAKRGRSQDWLRLSVILIEAATFLEDISLSESEWKRVREFHRILEEARTEAFDRIRYPGQVVEFNMQLSHPEFISEYPDVVLPEIAGILPGEAEFMKSSYVLGLEYDLNSSIKFFETMEQRRKVCHSVQTNANLRLHIELWKLLSTRFWNDLPAQCDLTARDARIEQKNILRTAGRRKWDVFGTFYRADRLTGRFPLKATIKLLERHCDRSVDAAGNQ